MVRVVTDLKIQNKNINRTNVYLNGEFGFGLANTLITTLRVGQELSEKQIADLLKKDEFEAAFHRADHFLGYKPRTSGEVARKLLMLKYNDDTVQEVVEKLTGQNLLNDKRFATQWVEERSHFKPKGRKLLEMELKQKKVAPEIIREALLNLDNEGLALKAAHEFAQKLNETDWVKFRQRISSFLTRRGFDYSEILPVVSKVWAEKIHEKKME
jgi:regulatory protein